MSFILLGILNSQVSAAGGGAAYDLLETTVLTSSASSITFSGLDAYTDYKHLQVRAVARNSNGNYNSEMNVQFNGVSGTSYAYHYVYGSSASGVSSTDGMEDIWVTGNSYAPNRYGGIVMDILDFASTNKNTTVRSLSGFGGFNSQIRFTGGLFVNTSAITSITFDSYVPTQDLHSGTRISLYGVKG